MNALQGLAWLLVLQVAGESLGRGFGLPVPGPVIGLLLLVPLFRFAVVRVPVSAAADVLLGHLSLLFVPVGVGVITHLTLISQYGWQLLLAIVVSTWVGLAVTAIILRALLKPIASPVRRDG